MALVGRYWCMMIHSHTQTPLMPALFGDGPDEPDTTVPGAIPGEQKPDMPPPETEKPKAEPEIPNLPKTPESEKPAGGDEISRGPDMPEIPAPSGQSEMPSVPGATDFPGSLH